VTAPFHSTTDASTQVSTHAILDQHISTLNSSVSSSVPSWSVYDADGEPSSISPPSSSSRKQCAYRCSHIECSYTASTRARCRYVNNFVLHVCILHETSIVANKSRSLICRGRCYNFPLMSRRVYKNSLTSHRRHLKTHTRPYRCDRDGCESTFAEKRDLRRHQQTHENDRPYFCPHNSCDRSALGVRGGFAREDNAKRHLRDQHRMQQKFRVLKKDAQGRLGPIRV
jgi:hypothetical protein